MSRVIKRVQYDPTPQGASVDIFYSETAQVNGQSVEVAGGFIKKTIVFPANQSNYAALMAYFQKQIESDLPVETVKSPNWGGFNLAIFSSANYQLLRNSTSNLEARNWGENTALVLGISKQDLDPLGYQFLKAQWDLFIKGLSTPPTKEVIAELNEIMLSTYMKFSLDFEGLLMLNLE